MRIIFFILFSSIAFAQEFTITERLFSPITIFDVSRDEYHVGIVTKQILSWGITYDIADLDSTLLATASTHFFSLGTIADLEDPDGKKLGCIEENRSGHFPSADFIVRNAQNEVVLIAEKNLLGNTFSLYEPTDLTHIVATITRPILRIFRDNWTIQIMDNLVVETIDLKFLILLAVYQTDKDNHARFWADIKGVMSPRF